MLIITYILLSNINCDYFSSGSWCLVLFWYTWYILAAHVLHINCGCVVSVGYHYAELYIPVYIVFIVMYVGDPSFLPFDY